MRLALIGSLLTLATAPAASLPESVTFVGKNKYNSIVAKGVAENWKALPIGERTARAGLSMVGTPYRNFTLELSATKESPCVNFAGMDCWTFFETALAMARVLKKTDTPSTQEFLRMIEIDRYRGGRCNGVFTSRLHYLEQWLADNQSRGLVKDITPGLPGARKLNRNMREMSTAWRNYRQLKANPSLIPEMARIEDQLSARGIYYVPKASVPAAEKGIRDGDIVCIVTTWPRSYTSHVGLAYRDKNGVLRFMHASKNAGEVIVDSRLSTYLNRYKAHAGIMVARPNDI